MIKKVEIAQEDNQFYMTLTNVVSTTTGQRKQTKIITDIWNDSYCFDRSSVDSHHLVRLKRYVPEIIDPRLHKIEEEIIGVAHSVGEAEQKAYEQTLNHAKKLVGPDGLKKIIDSTCFAKNKDRISQ